MDFDFPMSFDQLGLSDDVLKAIRDVGYEKPTPIQEKAIPYALRGSDVLGIAQTGTGKTASFTLPMIEILANGRAKARMPRSLVLTPTRELADQVANNFEIYGKYTKLSHALLVGGVSMGDQIAKLERGVDVLVATPGRLLDLFERGKILLRDIKVLVIDECDRMLDMGFIPDIERIVELVPKIRQTMLFSATMPTEVRKLADRFLMHPKEVRVAPPASTADTVAQHLVHCHPKKKRIALRHLIRTEDVRNAFIFCNRKRDVATLYESMQRHGFNVGALHGDMPQFARTETLSGFKNGDITLLVCSDVAARGLDIAGMSHVFNFDVPFNADDYVHRIGRTGRAGLTGRSFTLASKDDAKLLDAIEKRIGKPVPVFVPDEIGDLTSPEGAEEGRADRGDRSDRGGRGRRAERDGDSRRDRGSRNGGDGRRDRGRSSGVREHHLKDSDIIIYESDTDGAIGFGDDVPAFFLAGDPLPGLPTEATPLSRESMGRGGSKAGDRGGNEATQSASATDQHDKAA